MSVDNASRRTEKGAGKDHPRETCQRYRDRAPSYKSSSGNRDDLTRELDARSSRGCFSQKERERKREGRGATIDFRKEISRHLASKVVSTDARLYGRSPSIYGRIWSRLRVPCHSFRCFIENNGFPLTTILARRE